MNDARFEIIQIVPGLYPLINGVGDYALNLARQLKAQHGLNSLFIVSNPEWSGAENIEGFQVYKLTERNSTCLSSLYKKNSLDMKAFILHYVGYGYANRGCPFWLAKAFESLKSELSSATFLTAFHELYAYGKPWQSSFWLHPFQKQLTVRLGTISDYCVTSRENYAQRLVQLGIPRNKVNVLPIFSNVGEPQESIPLRERSKIMVVFGQKNGREKIYNKDEIFFLRACAALDIKTIIDIGDPLDETPSNIQGIPVKTLGLLPVRQISQYMRNAIAGFVSSTPCSYLAKSGVFAAYCAYGLIPVGICSHDVSHDGLVSGQHFLSVHEKMDHWTLDLGQKIADRAFQWHQTHNSSVHAKLYVSLINASRELLCQKN